MIQTVTGPIQEKRLGKTLMHEHFLFGYPGYQGDATPNECGRDPELMREISKRFGIHIICSTGYYYEDAGSPSYFTMRAAKGADVVSGPEKLGVSEL